MGNIVDITKNPKTLDEREWITSHIAKYAVAKPHDRLFDIYMYSNDDDDASTLFWIARKENKMFMQNVPMEGVTSIEGC